MATDKAGQWRAHQVAQGASGLSVAAYCRRHGLSYASWMYWQRRLGAAALLPIVVSPVVASSPASPGAASLQLELRLPGGVSLRVSGAEVTDVVALARGLSC